MPRTFFLAVLSVPLAGASIPAAQADEARDLAANCFQCHGTDGRAENGMPKLAGKSAEGLVKKMQEFRRSTEYKKVMTRHARGYTDEQLWRMGVYFEAIPESPGGENERTRAPVPAPCLYQNDVGSAGSRGEIP